MLDPKRPAQYTDLRETWREPTHSRILRWTATALRGCVALCTNANVRKIPLVDLRDDRGHWAAIKHVKAVRRVRLQSLLACSPFLTGFTLILSIIIFMHKRGAATSTCAGIGVPLFFVGMYFFIWALDTHGRRLAKAESTA